MRLILGRIECSRRVLEAKRSRTITWKSSRRFEFGAVARVRVVRAQQQRAPVHVDGLLQIAVLPQGVAQVVAGVREVGLDVQRDLEDPDGPLEVALLEVARRQVAVGDGEARVELDGPRVLGDGRVDLALLLEHVAQVRVRVERRRLPADRFPIVRRGVVQAPPLLVDGREGAPGGGQVRRAGQRLRVAALGDVAAARGPVEVAQMAPRLREARIDQKRGLVGLERLPRLAEVEVRRREIIISVREPRLERDGLEVEPLRAARVAELLERVRQIRVGLGEARRALDAAQRVARAVLPAAQLEVDRAQQEEVVDRVVVRAAGLLAARQRAREVAAVVLLARERERRGPLVAPGRAVLLAGPQRALGGGGRRAGWLVCGTGGRRPVAGRRRVFGARGGRRRGGARRGHAGRPRRNRPSLPGAPRPCLGRARWTSKGKILVLPLGEPHACLHASHGLPEACPRAPRRDS